MDPMIKGEYSTRLNNQLDEKLDFINNSLKDVTFSQIHSVLGTPSKYIISSGGKRLRPLLCTLCAELVKGDYRRTKNAFIALELIHNATLIHDDIIDGDLFRRGKPSVPFVFGGKRALLTGDAIFSLGLKYAAKTDKPCVVDWLAETALKMVQGVALQSINRSKIISEEEYFYINYLKSGSLFEAAAVLGGVIGSDDKDDLEKLSNFGKNFGNAYQIRDDVYGFFSEDDNDSLTRNDLLNGDISLPFIYTINSKTIHEKDKEFITAIYKGEKENFELKDVYRIYMESGALEKSTEKMKEFAINGRKYLDDFEKSDARCFLNHLLERYYINNKETINL